MVKTLTNAEYRKVDAYSKSDIDEILFSGAQYEWSRTCRREETDATEIGTAVHAAILEPVKFMQDYLGAPLADLRNAAGKAADTQFRKAAEAYGRIVLSHDDYQMVINMRDSVMAHPTARTYLTTEGGVSEAAIFWEEDGVKKKCLVDHIPNHENVGRVMLDVKSIENMDKLWRHILDFNYHVQSEWYRDGGQALYGERPRFIFIFVAKTRSLGRHPVRVIELSQEWLDKARDKIILGVDRIKEIESFGIGLDVEILPFSRSY